MEQIQGFFTQITAVLAAYLPKAVGALILLVVAWAIAGILRAVVSRLCQAAKLDERAGFAVSRSLSEIVYWLVFLFFLPGVLEALGLQQLLLPVQNMVSKILDFLPNLLAAGIIFLIGYFVAKLVRNIVANIAAAAGADKLTEKFGLAGAVGDRKISDVLGLIVFVLIVIPVAQSALSALQLDVVTRPIEAMMAKMVTALPNIVSAAIVLLVASFIGRLAGGFVDNVLAGVGFNAIVEKIGLNQCGEGGACKASGGVGWLVTASIVLFAAMEAAGLLGFEALNRMVAQFMVFAGQLLMGVIILGIGVYLANLAAEAIKGSSASNASGLALVARIAIMIFSGAMALREMGLGTDIVNLTFGLVLGALAVAAALAFGLGGRESAGRLIGDWLDSIKK